MSKFKLKFTFQSVKFSLKSVSKPIRDKLLNRQTKFLTAVGNIRRENQVFTKILALVFKSQIGTFNILV